LAKFFEIFEKAKGREAIKPNESQKRRRPRNAI
jgi:hypothetical protein